MPLPRFPGRGWPTLAVTAPLRRHSTTREFGRPPRGTPVFVGMSGGVDSSVTARLLLEDGYDVRPYYMRNWDTLDELSGSGGCEWEKDFADVERLCRDGLGGIKPELVDLSAAYWQDVFSPALESWEEGQTPNPDVTCNGEIKFKALPNKLLARDPTAWLATGHYARLLPSPLNPAVPALHRSLFAPKDQSYYLSTAPIAALARTLFPLGSTSSKDEVRNLARKWSLHTSEKRESMGICFIGTRRNFSGFINSYIPSSPGDIEDESGKVVGKHEGLWKWTVGEGARLSGQKEKMFVGRKDVARNVVVIVTGRSPLLLCTNVETSDFKWIDPSHPPASVDTPEGLRCEAQTRSLVAGALSPCVVHRMPDSSLSVRLLDPIKAVSPGQAVVLYDGSWCLGGGTIHATRTLADDA